jgi:GT2 family glycosyltransferase
MSSGPRSSGPSVSVVIPAYHSDSTIAACLEALHTQTYRDFEVIVVNSSPEPRTEAIVKKTYPEAAFEQADLRLFPHAARNRGSALARGSSLVFTDPDCRAEPNWLERLVEAQRSGHGVVVGAMELASGRWFEQGVHLCKFSWLLSGLPPGPRWIAPTANACYSRAVWEAVGPFDDSGYSGDGTLSWRAARIGHAPWFEPRAIVRHTHGGSLRSLWRERFERGLEFSRVRASWESWSRARLCAYVAAAPVLPFLQLVRGGRDALRSGWGRTFLATLPVQLLGQTAWCLGEARGYLRLLRKNRRT